ncbi:hypothetical protein SCHPADRAFT_937846 [Schizopora paradoxa]|uniref:MYND-type domain-containing protein n=1 Tax=Schizopora paradoxa TaxID=27342 RepID=A0A0H2RY14_9AGAM|nr:hypothetical protein SCHPADRAFT_937846 [Schizopora paradoxa]
MADSQSSSKTKIHPKDISRILKKCNWCLKDEVKGEPPFKACSKCRATIYCGRECQVKAWSLHKTNCQNTAKMYEQFEGEPEAYKKFKEFKEWHVKHNQEISHAAICGLQLDSCLEDIDKQVFVMVIKRTPGPKVPYSERFQVHYCMNTGIDHCKKQLGPEADQIFEHLAATNAAYKKKKGFMGCVGCLLRYDGFSDLVLVKVPEMTSLKSRMYVWDWRANPVRGLNNALKSGLKIPDPLTAPFHFATVDENGQVVPAETKPVQFEQGTVIDVGKMVLSAGGTAEDINDIDLNRLPRNL